VPASDLRCSEP